MTVTLLVDTHGGGTASIYTGDPADESPHTTPLSNLSRLKFHSGLSYPKIINEWSGNVTFPARNTPGSPNTAAAATTVASQTLFAHGRSGFPWVLAYVDIGGVKVPFTGSVPVQVAIRYFDMSSERPWARWVSIGADATNVYSFEYTVVDRDASTAATECHLPQIILPITVLVTDEILE